MGLNIKQQIEILEGEYAALPSYSGDKKEGVDYINVNHNSESVLGKRLAPSYNQSFPTFIGECSSITNFMNAIKYEGYPLSLLNKWRVTEEQFNFRGAKQLDVPNYWSLVAYALCQKVKADEELQKMMKENELPYTCFTTTVNKTFFNKSVMITQPKTSLAKYVAIIRHIQNMLKEDRFTDTHIEKFISDCKKFPEKDFLAGTCFKVVETK